MSIYTNQTNITKNNYFFALANISTLVANNISANTVTAGVGNFTNLLANNISSLSLSTGTIVADSISTNTFRVNNIDGAGRIESYEFSSVFTYADEGTVSTLFTEHIILDQATLDVVGGTVLLLNGNPIATTNVAISSLADWAAFPAICTLKMSGSNIENAGNIYCQNIYNALNVQSDTASILTSITSPSATFTNSRVTNGLSTINFLASNAVNSNVSSINSRANSYVGNNMSTIGLQGQVGAFRSLSTINLSTATVNGNPVISGSNWSLYPAQSNVALAGYGLTTTGNLNITANSNIVESCQDYSLTADNGINIASITDIGITAQNGNRGRISLTANSGFNNGVAGEINLTANGGQVGGVGTGGTVNITANTPLGFSNLTSKIALNASGVNSYAGSIPSVASLYGYNFIYGQNGVNICSGLPSVIPNVPFTTFLYGTAGVVSGMDFYTPNIYPYWNGVTTPPDMNITGRVVNLQPVFVNLSNVKYLDMDFFAQIRQVKGITFCNTNTSNFISNADTIQGSNSISGYNSISATNVGFTTASGTTINSSNINGSNIIGSNYISTLNMNLSSINNFAWFGQKSVRVQGDVAQIQLSNNNVGGQGTILNLLSRTTQSEIQSFNSNFTAPLPLFLNASYVSSVAFNASTFNGQALPYPYGSFSRNANATIGVPNTAVSTIFDTTEIANGISIVGGTGTRVAVSTTGVYRWLASPQFDTSSGGANGVNFWFQKNGVAIPRSASKATVANNATLFSAVEIFEKMNAQDYIEFCFTSADTNMNLAYFPASGVIPANPAVILVGQKIAES